ncbi:hypothetical protein MSAN_00681500 [Mycena sanguinolenta]|uniref:F-box domain-containing protein n=1 Tax=Mycena sanguinolenta TaxID=230812 RepID=A0A8H7DEW8_9AGAR|nr:hypothetical protein MSAN_00681500 [Mycena sanguinolenta]
MDVGDVEHVFLECEEERRARELRIQHNAVIPIARLPPEILGYIFVRCVPAVTSISSLHNDVSWLNVTRVSSRWRSVALSCPDLWSTLILSRPKWVPVMLARSKNASLVVRVDFTSTRYCVNSPEPILLENVARLRTLDIRSPQDQLAILLANLEHAGSAPRLQHLRIVNTDVDNFAEGGTWLPRNLFHRTEVIESRKVGAQWGVRLHLERCAFPWDSGVRPTFEAFLAILMSCPNLQTLALIRCAPTTYRDGCTVELPHLSALTIECSSPLTCRCLLGCLKIPPSATIDAIVLRSRDNRHHYSSQDLLHAFSRDSGSDTYDTVRIEHKAARFTYSLRHSARPEWSRTLQTYAPWTYMNAICAMRTMRDHVDFSNITTLHLQAIDCLPPQPASKHDEDVPFHSTMALWDSLGRSLPGVHTLHLHKSFPALWLEFFLTQAMLIIGVTHYQSCFSVPASSPCAADVSKAKERDLPFRDPDGALRHGWPSLRCLALHEINIARLLGEQQPPVAEVLLALLWARRQGRAPIWRLEMKNCKNVSWNEMPYFELLADVEYDGKGKQTPGQGGEDRESLASYYIGIFAQTVNFSRLARRRREQY